MNEMPPIPPTPITLSAEQQRVVAHRGSHIQVIACAGSGKTESVACRVAALVCEGVRSHEIVAFTFTEKAAAELKERIVQRVTEAAGKVVAGTLAQMYVGTIHGYCLKLLQDHVPKYGHFDVVDEHRHAAFVYRFRKEIGLDDMAAGGTTQGVWASVAQFSDAVSVISNECVPLASVDATPFGPLYRAYIDVMDRLHLLTFARMTQEAVDALADPGILAKVAGQLKHLIVDEYQDINPAQDRLIHLMASGGAHVCVVGDDDQSIYQWRGSDVTYIQEFAARFPGAVKVVLHENRRSRSPIVEAASRFASSITTRITKTMSTTRDAGDAAVVAFRTQDAATEAAAIVDTISALRKEGLAYRDMAVLLRSLTTSAAPLTTALHAAGIPFVCSGKSGLFQQPEVRAFLKVHLWLGDQSWFDPAAQKDVILAPEAVAAELVRAFNGYVAVREAEAMLHDWRALVEKSRSAANLIRDYYSACQVLGVDTWAIESPGTVARLGSLARFSNVLADFENTTRRGRYEVDDEGDRTFRGGQDKGPVYYKRLAGFLRFYAEAKYEEHGGELDAGLDAVQIMTVHAAKGLEWPAVFLPALQDKRFPSSKFGTINPTPLADSIFPRATQERYAGGEDEERRLFYVAMTRARDVLYLSHFDRTARMASTRSRFLDPIHPAPFPTWTAPVIPTAVSSRQGATARPAALSLTELIRFSDCGYRFRLQRLLGFETQLVSELGFGRAIHHVLRRIADETRATGRIPGIEDLDRILDQELYFPFANVSSETLMRLKTRRLVEHYLNRHRDDLLRIWATERPFELHLPAGFLSGRADVILDGEGPDATSLAILDYKSSTDAARDEAFQFQLQVYSAAARAEGLDVSGAYLHDLAADADPRQAIDISPAACDAARARAGKLLEQVAQRAFGANPERRRCTDCEFKQICRHRHGDCR